MAFWPIRTAPKNADPDWGLFVGVETKTARRPHEIRTFGGEEEDRTPDLRIANAALSQLSYPPESHE